MRTQPQSSGSRFTKVTLLQPTSGQDGFGQVETSFQAIGTLWAQVAAIQLRKGAEPFVAGQFAPEVYYAITVRYQDVSVLFESGALADCWLTQGSKYFDIQAAISLDQRNQWIILQCVEKPGLQRATIPLASIPLVIEVPAFVSGSA